MASKRENQEVIIKKLEKMEKEITEVKEVVDKINQDRKMGDQKILKTRYAKSVSPDSDENSETGSTTTPFLRPEMPSKFTILSLQRYFWRQNPLKNEILKILKPEVPF